MRKETKFNKTPSFVKMFIRKKGKRGFLVLSLLFSLFMKEIPFSFFQQCRILQEKNPRNREVSVNTVRCTLGCMFFSHGWEIHLRLLGCTWSQGNNATMLMIAFLYCCLFAKGKVLFCRSTDQIALLLLSL